MQLKIAIASDAPDFAICMAIRKQVFINEQGVPPDEEWDDFDNEATHFLLKVDGQPSGTARLRVVDGVAKIERVALLKHARGRGLGAALMRHVMGEAKKLPGITSAKLGAQLQALGFYETLGFTAYGDPYDDAGIPHRWMQATL